jgi:hypothetical protein
MFLPALPTLAQLVAACPPGPWQGDERMRHDIASLGFASKLLNTILCHAGADNQYRQLAKSIGVDNHQAMVLGEAGREATMGMSPTELIDLYFSQRVTMSMAEDRVLRMGDPRAMMRMMLGAMGEKDEGPGSSTVALVREFVNQMFHLLVGLAVMRAMPGVPFAAHYINWAIIKGETVYICSYNVPGEDGKPHPMNADGVEIPESETHTSPDNDPRILANEEAERVRRLDKDGHHTDARQAILDDPHLAYSIY